MSLMLDNLNALAGGLFLIMAFGIVATRQVRNCLRFFIFQSIFLATSALMLGIDLDSWHLIAIGVINLITKPLLIPWILQKLVHEKLYTHREINQVLSVSTSLLVALVLSVAAYFISFPWIKAAGAEGAIHINLPIGLAGLLLGAYTLSVRREAVPQMLAILAMENGAFFAGVAIAPDLSVIAELAIAFDLLIMAFVVGVLTRTVHERMGNTAVGHLTQLREEPRL